MSNNKNSQKQKLLLEIPFQLNDDEKVEYNPIYDEEDSEDDEQEDED